MFLPPLEDCVGMWNCTAIKQSLLTLLQPHSVVAFLQNFALFWTFCRTPCFHLKWGILPFSPCPLQIRWDLLHNLLLLGENHRQSWESWGITISSFVIVYYSYCKASLIHQVNFIRDICLSYRILIAQVTYNKRFYGILAYISHVVLTVLMCNAMAYNSYVQSTHEKNNVLIGHF